MNRARATSRIERIAGLPLPSPRPHAPGLGTLMPGQHEVRIRVRALRLGCPQWKRRLDRRVESGAACLLLLSFAHHPANSAFRPGCMLATYLTAPPRLDISNPGRARQVAFLGIAHY